VNVERDLRVESRFKNAILYRVIREHFTGHGWLKEASGRTKVGYGTLTGLLRLELSPYKLVYITGRRQKKGERRACDTTRPTESAERLAEFFGMSFQELFPATLYALKLPKVIVREFSSPEVLSLQDVAGQLRIAPPQVEEMELWEREKRVHDATRNALSKLSPREEKVIKMRFGLDDGVEQTLGVVGQEFGVGRERIRQIEARAMRKLRYPSNSHLLREFIT